MARDSKRPHTLPFQHHLTPSPTLTYNSGYCLSEHNRHLALFSCSLCFNLSLSFYHNSFFPSLLIYFINYYLFFFFYYFSSPFLIIPFPYSTLTQSFPSLSYYYYYYYHIIIPSFNLFLSFQPSSFPFLTSSFLLNSKPIQFLLPPFPPHCITASPPYLTLIPITTLLSSLSYL